MQRNWLAVELDSVAMEIDRWSDGIRESFQSLISDSNMEAETSLESEGSFVSVSNRDCLELERKVAA
jgi:hypothetical protein